MPSTRIEADVEVPLVTPDDPPDAVPEAMLLDQVEGQEHILPLAFSEWETDGELIVTEPPADGLDQPDGPIDLAGNEFAVRLSTTSRPEYFEARFFDSDPRAEEREGSPVEPIRTVICHYPELGIDDDECEQLVEHRSGERMITLKAPRDMQYATIFTTWTVVSENRLADQYSAAWFAEFASTREGRP